MGGDLRRELDDVGAGVRGLADDLRLLAGHEPPEEGLRERLSRAGAHVRLAQEALHGDPPSTLEPGSALRSPAAESELFQARGSTFSIPDFLGFLQVQRKTGVLELDLPDERVELHIERGDLIDARSDHSPPDCRLGEILVARGLIERATLDEFVRRHPPGGQRLGRALGSEELISERELSEALSEQTLRLFARLHATSNVAFRFRECGPPEGRPDLRLNVVELLLESARQHDEASRAGTPRT